ncbi:putative N-acetyltransferase domain-containing protein [Seiridium cardinale]|uniref:N-acetyltransferase domain-containing protein n=1 Tax=Seiridium cardinale TaxID=138064 RepID=A0ABR2Y9S0_9PEZI
MPLAVLPALETDMVEVSDVFFEGFKDEPLMKFLYPHGVDRPAHVKATLEEWKHNTTTYTVKCVDSESGKILGMATWEIFWKPDKQARWERPTDIPWLQGKDKTRCLGVCEPMWDMRERLFGNAKHIYISSLATHPDYQRRGVGRALLRWGITIGEDLQLPIYTECSAPSLRLYESMGFERITHVALVHRADIIGEDHDAEVPLVVKMPSSSKRLDLQSPEVLEPAGR